MYFPKGFTNEICFINAVIGSMGILIYVLRHLCQFWTDPFVYPLDIHVWYGYLLLFICMIHRAISIFLFEALIELNIKYTYTWLNYWTTISFKGKFWNVIVYYYWMVCWKCYSTYCISFLYIYIACDMGYVFIGIWVWCVLIILIKQMMAVCCTTSSKQQKSLLNCTHSSWKWMKHWRYV